MKKIKDWDNLIGLENEKYKIEVEDGDCFWIVNKDTKVCTYLSTHFFYKSATHYYGFLEKYFDNVIVIR